MPRFYVLLFMYFYMLKVFFHVILDAKPMNQNQLLWENKIKSKIYFQN